MRTIWHSLAWKEWHEHKWKLAAIAAIVIIVSSAVPLSLGGGPFGASAFAPVMTMFCLMPLTVYVAAKEATGERAIGTLSFLRALPVPPRQIALHKLGFGLMTCLIPAAA